MAVATRKKSLSCLLVLLLAGPGFCLDFALDATVGSMVPSGNFKDPNLDFVGHLWYPFDQMVFLGAGCGLQIVDGARQVPFLGSLNVRLPIGGVVLPVAMGDIGYVFGDDPQMQWRAGGGFDIKNGNHSSLLLQGGYQRFYRTGGFYYLRAGILLEI